MPTEPRTPAEQSEWDALYHALIVDCVRREGYRKAMGCIHLCREINRRAPQEHRGIEMSCVTGHTSYIRPVYRNDAFIGFAVYVGGEAVGRVFAEYKQAVLLLMQIRAEQSTN